jgi:hypothetical protein
MATNNVLNNASAPFTVTTGGLTVSTGSTTLTPIASSAATGVVTVSNAGILAEVGTGAAGTVFVGTATSPKFLAAGTSGYVLQTNGASADPTWVVNAGGGAISGQTQYAVEVGGSGGSIASLLVGASNTTLMGNTGANPSWTGSPSFSGSVTVGSGNLTVTSGNLSLPATTATIGQITLGGSLFMHAYGGSTSGNTFVGINAGNLTMTSAFNTGIGYNVLSSATSTNNCTGVGAGSLAACTSGTRNTACGSGALAAVTTTGYNTACGYNSLYQLVSGSYNIALGALSGGNYTGSETGNICIGYNVGGTIGESNVLRIGAGTGTGSGQINAAYISGIQTITVTGSAVLVSSSDQLGVAVSSRRFKENIREMGDDSDNLHNLRPVAFNYKSDEDKNMQYGLIAEEVAEIYPELIAYDKEGKPFTVYYHVLPAMLLNEIQKLRRRIEELESQEN